MGATMLDRFRSLFRGGELGYGEWSQQSGPKTIRGPVPLAAYERHLSGEVGLGLVPVTMAGTCHFAVIDIDIDTIDHAKLYQDVVRRRLPLHVCRSKSGAAHLYLFPEEPLPATLMQSLLKRWATLLGYPQAEIFPKQTKIGGENVGNWINLPYFGGNRTTRYAIAAEGALSLEAFLEGVQRYDPKSWVVDETASNRVNGAGQLPPCLAALSQHQLPEGAGRNNVLFNTAVFYRKSSPSDWESKVTAYNEKNFDPPLDYREVQSTIRSAGRVRYQYTCEQSPLKDYCDKAACVKLPFGVSSKPWEETGAYDDLLVAHLRKLSSNPPRYILEVNGRDLEVSAEDFMVYAAFRKKVYQSLDLMIIPMKQPQWEQQIRELTSKLETIEAPEDASVEGLVIQRFEEFLSLRERSTSRDDILRGLPVTHNDQILFRVADFRRHLQIFKLDKLEGSELFFLLRKKGCTHTRVRIAGKSVALWQCPVTSANDQSEDFAIPEFEQGEEPF